ncbi:MAG: L,D-transpeptidase [Arenimonas sp.]
MKSDNMLKFALINSLLALSISNAFAAADTSVQLTAAAVNDTTLLEVVDAKAGRVSTLRAQILLDRAHFSPGEIDASFGGNMRNAISAYQASNNLTVSGTIDAATWAALNKDDLPALSTYTITEADAAGPFMVIPASMLEKSKLPALGYSSSAEALGEKFHISPRLLQQLNTGKNFNTAGEELIVPNVLSPEPLPAAAKVVVDRSDSSVSLLDATDKVIARYPASSGSKYDPLPVGDWKINGTTTNPVFHYNPKLFWDAKPKSEKAVIPAGPNNPVGSVWVDLSKEHYGIHGTPEPSKIGKTESHGCIRLSNWNATEFAAAVSPGMAAKLQE